MKTRWIYHGRWINVDPAPSLLKRVDPMYTTSTGHRICAICGDTVLLPYFHSICGKHTYIPVGCPKQPDLGHIDIESIGNMLGIYSRGGGPTGIYYDYQPEIIGHPPLKEDEVALNSEFSYDSLPLLVALVIERLHNLNYKPKQA